MIYNNFIPSYLISIYFVILLFTFVLYISRIKLNLKMPIILSIFYFFYIFFKSFCKFIRI